MENEPLEYFFKETTTGCPDFLVIWLHGLGADGYDFAPLAETLELPPEYGYRFVFPHASFRPVTINGGAEARAWYDIVDLKFEQRSSKADVEISCKLVSDLMEIQRSETGIPYHRIFLGGFSQGGAIALHLGLRFPLKLAGIIGLSTYLISPLDIIADRNPANQDTPVLLSHGSKDNILPFFLAEETEKVLLRINQPYKFYPHQADHSVPFETMKAVGEWLSDKSFSSKK